MNITVSSELYDAGRTEDGQVYAAERYLVWAEDIDGTRYEHRSAFNGCRVSVCEEDGYNCFEDIREEAKELAEKLAERVRDHLAADGALNMAYWHEIDPAYGSASYISQGIEEQRAFMDKFEG